MNSPTETVTPKTHPYRMQGERTREMLEALCHQCDVPFRPQILRERSGIDAGPEDVWTQRWSAYLADVGESLGLRIQPPHIPLASYVPPTGAFPLVCLVQDERGDLAWLILLESHGDSHRVRIVGNENEKRWLSTSELGQWKSPAGGNIPLQWCHVEPLLPCEPQHAEPEHQHPSSGTGELLSRLFGLLRQDRRDLRIVVWYALGASIFSLATPIAVEAIVATVQGGSRILLQPVLALSAVLLCCLGLASFFRVMQSFVVEFLQQRIFVRVTADLAYRFPRAQAQSFDHHHGPELVNRFFDVLTVQKAGAMLLVDGLSVVIQTAVGLIVLAFYSPYLLGFDIVLIGALAFIIFVLGRGGIRTSIDESYAKYHVAAWLEEMARHPQTFKQEGGPEFAWARADELAREYVSARRSHFKIVFRQNLFSLILLAVSSAALFALGGWLVINRQLTLGQLVAAELLLTMIVGSFVKLGKSLESYYDLMAALDKLGHLSDLPMEVIRGEPLPHQDGPASLAARNLCFTYEGTQRSVFDNLSFDIQPGERVALVGPHGAGKSTLLDMIFGLREPNSGGLEFDGIDYRELRLDSLREQIATAKGAEIFEGSVLENVRVGRSWLGLPDIRNALEKLELYDEIRALPQGMHTTLATGGAPLSYGQIRRLVKARAIASRPRLLLLDEGLDNLPNYLQKPILDTFFDPQTPWTLVVATHNPEVMRRVDRCIILGNHESFPRTPQEN